MMVRVCLCCEVCICYYWFCVCFVMFLFKQKTAYEMRISDWSSDVCSSDLLLRVRKLLRGGAAFLEDGDHLFEFGVELGDRVARRILKLHQPLRDALDDRGLLDRLLQILARFDDARRRGRDAGDHAALQHQLPRV